MNQETCNMLRELAHKLGTTVEYLWPLMVGKERLDALMCIVLSALAFPISAFLAIKSYKNWNNEMSKPYNENEPFIPFISMVVLVVAFFLSICVLTNNISCFMYPEVTVIKSLLHR